MNKILIANRGEIARRVIRTCREMGIPTVAVFADPDRHAPFVAEADEAVPLGGATPGESYLQIEKILAAAARSHADAIHPGYGFLSENAEFARQCAAAGLTFLGPPAAAIAAMGSKIEAKRLMRDSGVPVLPSIEIPEKPSANLLQEIERLGWPVLIKASAGGGGRGMRIVRDAAAWTENLAAAQRESLAGFGSAAVFVEPYVEAPRHIEFQIFGDQHGKVIHLFERECSIQRRYQKIVEESPSTALDDALRAAMGAAAVRAGEAIGYVGAGTVEFLLTPDKTFYFLEVNTRLQVEHPVTECITGLDLVRLQIEVAQGASLADTAANLQRRGHAIEVRLYAEDPRREFMPATGRLERFQMPTLPGLRVDAGVVSGSEVTPYYDAMLAKFIVHAPTRDEAARRLARGLAASQIHGLRTNRDLLVRILEHPEFLAGDTDTHFLERNPPAELGAPTADAAAERLHAAAAALAAQAERRAGALVAQHVPSGWRNNLSQLQSARFSGEQGTIDVRYAFHRDRLELHVNGEELTGARVAAAQSGEVRLEVAGLARTYSVHRVGQSFFVDSPLGSSELKELDRFPLADAAAEAGSLVAPLPGLVDQIKVAVGDPVAAGDTLIVIESMKMLHSVSAPLAGTVSEIRVSLKSHVEAGAVLAVIEEAAAD
ncbi:MAG: ATP-grasp domain-containing protein [Planctomycetaceae bacterium]|nr:ATP-grasp domain-containing protein [Planctomycetaceae bacterium]